MPRVAPNTGTDQWNWRSMYENTTNLQAFAAANQGTWQVKLQKDAVKASKLLEKLPPDTR